MPDRAATASSPPNGRDASRSIMMPRAASSIACRRKFLLLAMEQRQAIMIPGTRHDVHDRLLTANSTLDRGLARQMSGTLLVPLDLALLNVAAIRLITSSTSPQTPVAHFSAVPIDRKQRRLRGLPSEWSAWLRRPKPEPRWTTYEITSPSVVHVGELTLSPGA